MLVKFYLENLKKYTYIHDILVGISKAQIRETKKFQE